MAKILCITSGLTGILNASFQLVRQLKIAKHEVIYAAPRNVGERVEAQGIKFYELPFIPQNSELSTPQFQGSFRKLKRSLYKMRNARKRKLKALEQLRPIAFEKLVQSERPDILLIDIELHEYIIRAYRLEPKLLLLSQWFSTWKRKGLPYLLTPIIPGQGIQGADLGIELNWQKIKWQRWWTFLKKKIRSAGSNRRTILMEYAKEQNFPLSLIKENYWPGPFSYDQLPVLSMVNEAMEFPHDKRPEHYYVGPMVDESRIDPKAKSDLGHTLKEVFNYQKMHHCKLIYCSLSTLSKNDEHFIAKLIAVFEQHKDWMLVLSGGKRGVVENKGKHRLANVFEFNFVPQLTILANADCSINHGGIHTINECVHFEVPMLVYSGKMSDQNGCAARVEFHKLGKMADKDKDQSINIEQKIDFVLNDAEIKRNLKQMKLHAINYSKDFVAAHLMTKLLSENIK